MQYRFCAVYVASCFVVAACGGGGGGSSSFTPASPPPPNTTVSDLQFAETFQAITTTLSIDATSFGGATINGQNAEIVQTGNAGPGRVSYNPSGDSFTFTAPSGIGDIDFSVDQGDIDASLTDELSTVYATETATTTTTTEILGADNGIQSLDYVTFGEWARANGPDRTIVFGHSVFGVQTLASDMPTTGTAQYQGLSYGALVDESRPLGNISLLRGDLTINANFETGAVETSMAFFAQPLDSLAASPWDIVTSSGAISSGTNAFSGAASAVGDSSLTGVLNGAFFGPAASEAGGTWSVSNGTVTASGAFAGAAQ
ncbi:MAG: transferrin-binding protein-like solute binding protein [Pseudomonadota bacterium]